MIGKYDRKIADNDIAQPSRLVVGVSGASGVILGIRMLQILQPLDIETHVVISPAAKQAIKQETEWRYDDVLALCSCVYNHQDVGSAIASGSFATCGMIVVPCSIKTLSAVANSFSADLMSRAADVTLKEGRKLVLVVREAPYHPGHIRLLQQASDAGAILFPPVPAFYARPESVDEIIDNIVGRILMRIGIENNLYMKWKESPDWE